MALQSVNLGAVGTGAGGDTIRAALVKINANFSGAEHAASRLVQSSKKDFTAAALLTPAGALHAALASYGDYYPNTSGANIDNAVAGDAGLYSTGNAGTWPAGTTWLWVRTQATYSGSLMQVAHDYSGTGAPAGLMFFRVRGNSGTWGEWRKVFTDENIVGTVSQSGGLPTGAIIERGSNANGEYVRFADGTQICWALKATAYTTDYPAGNIYIHNAVLGFTFPAAFYSASSVSVSDASRFSHPSLGGAGTARGWGHVSSVTGGSVSLLIYGHSAVSAMWPGYIAIGRWC